MFVKRNANGTITAISWQQSAQFSEEIDANSPELADFLSGDRETKKGAEGTTLAFTDTELVRVLEDLIQVLTEKGVIQFTDLPMVAQRKLLSRRSLRAQHNHLDLIEPEEDESFKFL